MALLLSTLNNHVQHALGGSVSSLLDATQIVNEAGRYMYSHPWKFRERPSETLDFVADASHVDLPVDFGELIAYSTSDGLNRGLAFTTFQDLLLKRSQEIRATGYYYAAISYHVVGGTPTSRIDIWPTPTSNEDGALTIFYRAKWVDLSADADTAHVPPYAESLLIQYVRAFAQGYEEEGMEQRLAAIDSSSMAFMTQQSDGLVQPDYGHIQNGAVASQHAQGRIPFDSIAGP